MRLLQNYHMHTARCGHAVGTDREYIENAIQSGYETVGFSDHTPFPDMGDRYVARIRMQPERLEEYVQSILRLREEYKSQIRILLGLEVEYYPNHFDDWKAFISPYPFDYFILGQHNIGTTYEELYSSHPTDDKTIVSRYVDQVIDAIQTGAFLYIAHPDLVRYNDTKDPCYRDEMRRLCEAAKGLKVPLEINLLGIVRGRWYPNPDFWEIAGGVGNDVIIGADAHDPGNVYPVDALAVAESMIERFHLNHIQNIL